MNDVLSQKIRRVIVRSTTVAILLVMPSLASAADDVPVPTVEVAHFWIAPSENKALDVYRRAWTAAGGRWTDTMAANRTAELQMVLDRIANGYPPTVMQWNVHEGSQELSEMGVVQDIEEVATADHWRDFLPASILEAITYKGRVFLAPTNIHAENWLWTNRKIFDELGLEPPRSWDEVLSSAEKIAAAGHQPIAVGNGPWEVSLIFNAIIYGVYGRDDYLRLMKGADAQAVMDDRMIQALELLRRLKPYISTDRTDKTWAGASRAVGEGRAAMQFMGDWAKGELLNAGFVLGKDFRCSLTPGTADTYFLDIDAFAFPLTNRIEDQQAQALFARKIMQMDNQVAFNAIKGAISVRTDVTQDQIDSCARIGLDRIANSNLTVPAQSSAMPTHMSEGWIVAVANYLNNSSITPKVVQKELYELLWQK
jgi:glucose/mannose transport system substrate-binding protein